MLTREETTSYLFKQQLALTAFFSSITRSYHLAEDVYQEICIKAISNQDGFESETHLLNWIRLAGKNRSIDILRARDGKYEGLTDDVLDRLATACVSATQTRGTATSDRLKRCMDSLTPNNREILRLRYFEGQTSSAIAQRLQRKTTTVYQTIARIHKSLSDCMQQRTLPEGSA